MFGRCVQAAGLWPMVMRSFGRVKVKPAGTLKEKLAMKSAKKETEDERIVKQEERTEANDEAIDDKQLSLMHMRP